jgi:hypothetical protein
MEQVVDRALHFLEVGHQVAVLPLGATSDGDVLEITFVSNIRAFTVQLANGRLYARTDGRGLVTNDFIQPANELHRQAIKRRSE